MSDTFRVLVGPKGRVVIPVELRREHGIEEGTELAAISADDGVLLLSRDAVKRRLRAMFANVPTSMATDLVNERRAAAAEESKEW